MRDSRSESRFWEGRRLGRRTVIRTGAVGGAAAFLVACDAAARTVVAPLELPVGIITAVIGGPFFLWLLIRQR